MDEQNKNLEEKNYVEKEKTFLQKAIDAPVVGKYINVLSGEYFKEKASFLQKACGIPIIGGYITLGIALIPPILMSVILFSILYLVSSIFISHHNTKFSELEIYIWTIVFLGLTCSWLIFIERKGGIIACTPHVPLPLKWVALAIVILLSVMQFN